mmetsp:Transcript_45938/g.141963  ORF Transcript_45938/g.141963 Transcript_45938/m.141963 type:complete len:355 (-) Transcript_45938:382-1446(-)
MRPTRAQRVAEALELLQPVLSLDGFRCEAGEYVYVDCLRKRFLALNVQHILRIAEGKAYRGWLRSRQGPSSRVRLHDLPGPPDLQDRVQAVTAAIELHHKLNILLGFACPTAGQALQWAAPFIDEHAYQQSKHIITTANAAKHVFDCNVANVAVATPAPLPPEPPVAGDRQLGEAERCAPEQHEPEHIIDITASAVSIGQAPAPLTVPTTPPASVAGPAPCTPPPPLPAQASGWRLAAERDEHVIQSVCGTGPGLIQGTSDVPGQAEAGAEPALASHSAPEGTYDSPVCETPDFILQQAFEAMLCAHGHDFSGGEEDLIAVGMERVELLISSEAQLDWLESELWSAARDLLHDN